MTSSEYTFLINKPDTLNEQRLQSLEAIIEKYPYFQSARIVRLKQLYNQDSYKYNYSLKVAAAFTTDRTVLFDFITSKKFLTLQNSFFDKKTDDLLNISVTDFEIIDYDLKRQSNTLENSIESSINSAASQQNSSLNIGKPLPFSVTEKHSFQEWLQLSRIQPIIRNENVTFEDSKTKHDSLIDKFIATNPKIPALDKRSAPVVVSPVIEEKAYLMTETLAKVYLEQKKYLRAIQAYEILILKYPEKSSYFANCILEIKELQQNNNS